MLRDNNTLEQHLLSVPQVFEDCKAFQMKPEWDKLLHNGNHIMENDCIIIASEAKQDSEFSKDWYRAYDSNGQFLGVYEKTGKKFVPVKMFL